MALFAPSDTVELPSNGCSTFKASFKNCVGDRQTPTLSWGSVDLTVKTLVVDDADLSCFSFTFSASTLLSSASDLALAFPLSGGKILLLMGTLYLCANHDEVLPGDTSSLVGTVRTGKNSGMIWGIKLPRGWRPASAARILAWKFGCLGLDCC